MTGCVIPRRGIYYVRLTYYDMNHRRRDKWVSTGLSGRGAKQKATAMIVFNATIKDISLTHQYFCDIINM